MQLHFVDNIFVEVHFVEKMAEVESSEKESEIMRKSRYMTFSTPKRQIREWNLRFVESLNVLFSSQLVCHGLLIGHD